VPPFEVTQGHIKGDGSIGYAYRKAMGLSRTVSDMSGDIGRAKREFSYPSCI